MLNAFALTAWKSWHHHQSLCFHFAYESKKEVYVPQVIISSFKLRSQDVLLHSDASFILSWQQLARETTASFETLRLLTALKYLWLIRWWGFQITSLRRKSELSPAFLALHSLETNSLLDPTSKVSDKHSFERSVHLHPLLVRRILMVKWCIFNKSL